MSRPCFLADHDLTDHIVTGVLRRQPAVEFPRARQLGWHALPDDEVLARSAAEGLIVVSHDVNTMTAAAYARLAAGLPLAGLLMAQQHRPVGRVVEDLILVWSLTEAEQLDGQVRFLPFR